MRRVESLKAVGQVLGSLIRFKIVKNNLATPFRVCDLDLINERGFLRGTALLRLALGLGIVKRVGAYYRVDRKRIEGHSFYGTGEELENNEALYEMVEGLCRSRKVEPLRILPDRPDHIPGLKG